MIHPIALARAQWAKLSPVHQQELHIAAHVFVAAFTSALAATYNSGIHWSLDAVVSAVIAAGVAAARVTFATFFVRKEAE